VTTGRQVPYCLFTDPELARIGLSETEAETQGIAYRLFKVPMETNLRARTLSETRGFVKALVKADTDRVLGFTAFGVGAGEILAAVQIAMIAGLPYTALRDAVLTHPTLGRRPHISILIRGGNSQRCRDERGPDLRRMK
jgi:pyruvate/2-oxoglutarate dehydrogenase complex dihydrolipoamide dehydrogenase (E3) component